MILKLSRLFLGKREITNGNSFLSSHVGRLLFILFLILVFHTIAMIKFEKLSIGDAIWLTMTSATTVGYGDLSAQTTAGRIATIILLYIGGIAILAQVGTMYFEHAQEARNRILKGDWSWDMNNHIIFISCSQEIREDYFYQAILGLRKSNTSFSNLPVIIVCEKFKDGISNRLRRLNIVHISKPALCEETLESASVSQASVIVLLSKDPLDPESDSINFELTDRLREMNVKGRIIAEVVRDENRSRVKKAGADNILRPIRAYPELMVRSIVSPGSEQVIETLFDSNGEECIRYEVDCKCSWLHIIKQLAYHDLGVPIAYENFEGNVINNPSSKEKIHAKAVFVIVGKEKIRKDDEIKKILIERTT